MLKQTRIRDLLALAVLAAIVAWLLGHVSPEHAAAPERMQTG